MKCNRCHAKLDEAEMIQVIINDLDPNDVWCDTCTANDIVSEEVSMNQAELDREKFISDQAEMIHGEI